MDWVLKQQLIHAMKIQQTPSFINDVTNGMVMWIFGFQLVGNPAHIDLVMEGDEMEIYWHHHFYQHKMT